MCLYTKNEPYRTRSSFCVAEREGFEPPEPLSSTVFKTAAIDHSAISPSSKLQASQMFFWGDFLKSGAKVLLFCDMTKYFFTFFSFFAKFYHLLYTYSFLFANTIKKTYLCRTINP